MGARLSLIVAESLGRELVHWNCGMRRGRWFCFLYERRFYWVVHFTILLGSSQVHLAIKEWRPTGLPDYVCSTTFPIARLPARSCSAVKTCPQVLHRHFEVDLPGLRTPGVTRAFSLGLNAIASSPPHPRHIRFSIVV